MRNILYSILFVFFCRNVFCQNTHWLNDIYYSQLSSGRGTGIDLLGNIYTAGTYTHWNKDATHPSGVFISKYDPNGNLLWADTSNASWAASSSGITIDKSGNSYITGTINASTITFGSYQLTTPSIAMYLVKYNSLGTVLWAKQIDKATPKSIALDNQGNLHIMTHHQLKCNLKN